MSNYYYLGRSAFPDILIWVMIFMLIGGSGFITMMAGLASKAKVESEMERLKDQKQRLNHELNGGNMESAMQAVSKFRADRGGIGDYENFERDMINNARLERRHAQTILRMIDDGKSDAEIEKWLDSQIYEGIVRRLDGETALIALYEGLISGTDKRDELLVTLKSDKRIPVEIVTMAEHPEFDFIEGARAKLNFYKGHNSNTKVQLEDLMRQEEESMLKTDEKHEERTKLLPELKNQFFVKSKAFIADREELASAQTDAWGDFLLDTKKVVDKRRKGDLDLYEKEQILKNKQDLLVTKVEGQDWIPPLDQIDGKILTADQRTSSVTINIGRLDALKVGQKFDVYKIKGDTLLYVKGRIEVVKLLPKISVCTVLESEKLDPIAENDVVSNGPNDIPFDRKLSPSYVLSGRFFKSYSRELVQHMIESSGGDVRTNIDKNVNYVIIGDVPNDDDIKLCRQLGVRTVRVRDLPTQLDYSYAEVESLKKKNWN